MIKQIGANAYGVVEYAVSFESEVEQLPTAVGQGSVCVVLENTNVYMFDESDDKWKLFVGGSSSGGGSGIPGINGREIELQKGETAIQWRYVGDAEWIDLVALDELKGRDGVNGRDGIDGRDGITPNIQIGTVTTLEPGEEATVTITGTKENPILNFAIPQGAKGDKGESFKEEIKVTPIIESTLNLTTDKYQLTTMENNTEIVLPTVDKYTEIHLFFTTTEELTLTLPSIKWQTEPTLEANKTYEFIFTYANEWLGGMVVYSE